MHIVALERSNNEHLIKFDLILPCPLLIVLKSIQVLPGLHAPVPVHEGRYPHSEEVGDDSLGRGGVRRELASIQAVSRDTGDHLVDECRHGHRADRPMARAEDDDEGHVYEDLHEEVRTRHEVEPPPGRHVVTLVEQEP